MQKLAYISLPVLLFAAVSCSRNTSRNKGNAVDSSAIKHEINDYNKQFAVDAANASWAKLTMGKMAKSKGATAAVKQLGELLMQGHTRENDTLIALADTEHITIPRVMGSEQQRVMDSLNLKEGIAFDRAFVDYMAATYRKEIRYYEEAQTRLSSAHIRAFATATLPMLKEHLAACEHAGAALH